MKNVSKSSELKQTLVVQFCDKNEYLPDGEVNLITTRRITRKDGEEKKKIET